MSDHGGVTTDETPLVAAAVRGEQDALRELWERHRRWAAAIIVAHKPAWAETDDILQDVAATLVKKIGTLRDPAIFKPWLRTIAANAARAASRDLAHRRRAIPFPSTTATDPLDQRPAADGTPDAPASRRDDLAHGQRLLELAAQLPEGYREPLIMRCVRDMSYRQIGQVLGLPETTIETRIARARRMLRDLAHTDPPARSPAAPAPAPGPGPRAGEVAAPAGRWG